MDEIILNFIGKTCRDAIYIDLSCMSAFRFEKYLMAGLVSKFHDLVLYGGAVTRPNSINHSCIEWGLVEIRTDNFVCFLCGVSDPTGNLFHMEHSIFCVIQRVKIMFILRNAFWNMRKERGWSVTILPFTTGKIDRLGEESTRSPCFEATDFKTE